MNLKEITEQEYNALFDNDKYYFQNGCCFEEETDKLIAFPYYESIGKGKFYEVIYEKKSKHEC